MSVDAESLSSSTPSFSIFHNIMSFQWDARATLDLHRREDGGFYCSGNKNDNSGRCFWRLDPSLSKKIDALLRIMSSRSILESWPYLESLANLSLCDHHRYQAGRAIAKWTRAMFPSPTNATYLSQIESDLLPTAHLTTASARGSQIQPGSVSLEVQSHNPESKCGGTHVTVSALRAEPRDVSAWASMVKKVLKRCAKVFRLCLRRTE